MGTARLWGAAVCLYAVAAHAQPASVQPGVVERSEEKAPKPLSSPGLVIPEIATPQSDGSFDKIRFTLRSVTFTGNTVVDTKTLEAEFASLIGHDVSLGDVSRAVSKITTLYASRGYALSLAYLPAQEIKNGAVRVVVVEGYVERVEVHANTVIMPLIKDFGEKTRASKPVKTVDLEEALLLANDLPGVQVRSVLDRGTHPGAMTLALNTEYEPFNWSLTVDNRGTRAAGPWRGRASISANSLLFGGDRLTADYLGTFDGSELSYAQGSYFVTLNEDGTTAEIEASNSSSQPGTPDLSAINFKTHGIVGTLRLSQSLIRSRAENLSVSAAVTYKDLEGTILGTTNSIDHLRVASLGARYDTLMSGNGLFTSGVTLSHGFDVFDATDLANPTPSRLGADAIFTKIETSLSIMRPLKHGFSVLLSGMGQYSDSPLLSSEQCGYGGSQYGRAFDAFEISGDHCGFVSAELRYAIDPPISFIDALQLYAFADAGWVWKRGFTLPGEARQQERESAGIGLRTRAFDLVDASIEYASPLNTVVGQEKSDDGRVFFSLTVAN